MRTFAGIVGLGLGLASTGCQVDMGPNMLLGSLTLEMREPEIVGALCGRPIDENEIGRRFSTLKVKDIKARRELFGSHGHGTAHVDFQPEHGAACSGTVEYDFSQDSRIVKRYKRSVQHSNTFYYANVVVKHP
ncbi:MAG TPA: hypothetical protein VFQ35_26985 [Polyangiaceae bacterium]|nr:hypothetical protein [Polyangiaceae bacterium]